jgi:hypothetical protein
VKYDKIRPFTTGLVWSENKIKYFISIGKELLAPTLLSVRKKTLSNDIIPTEETTIGEDDEEDPMVTHLEQDETEIETETQRKQK